MAFTTALLLAATTTLAAPVATSQRAEARAHATAQARIIAATVIDWRQSRPPAGAKRTAKGLLEFE